MKTRLVALLMIIVTLFAMTWEEPREVQPAPIPKNRAEGEKSLREKLIGKWELVGSSQDVEYKINFSGRVVIEFTNNYDMIYNYIHHRDGYIRSGKIKIEGNIINGPGSGLHDKDVGLIENVTFTIDGCGLSPVPE